MLLWRLLVVLRIALTLVPQTGYIHPDEFFQSIEVVAGDVLDLRVHLPWEFNSSASSDPPIRNILIPYVVVGMPLYFLKCLSDLSELFLDVTLLSPYLLLVLPRLTMALLSVCTDACLRRLCRLFGRNHVRCLCVYGSSQVVLVFLTRTLSNSIEYFLFVALLSTVSDDLHDIDRLKRTNRNDEGDGPGRRFHWLGTVTAIGFFNRPTFLAFAFVPLIIWTLYGINQPGWNPRRILERCFSLAPAFLATSALMVLVDTAYYGHVTDHLLRWNELANIRWIVTPFNFLSYNLSGNNLLRHGLHPRYVHLLVNNVLLFGVLGVIGLVAYFRMMYTAVVKRQPTDSVVDKMCACSFAFPILILSFAPHQEPRFILPVLFPLAFLHAEKLYNSRWTSASWIALNVVGCAFFGFVHQAGVVPSLVHLQRSLLVRDGPLTQVDHVVYYHTYMPPRSLLLRPKMTKDCSVQRELEVHDLMGSRPEELHRSLDNLRGTVVVVSPTSLRDSVVEAVKPFEVSLHTRFWMHLSFEDPPPLDVRLLDRIGLDLHLVQVWKNVTRVKYLSAA